MKIDLEGQVALVTGAAHGIGRAICRELAQAGAEVFCLDVLEQELKETVDAVREAGGQATGIVADVTSPEAMRKAVEQASKSGGLHILVNAAGGVLGQVGRPAETVPPEDWDAIIRVNLYGTFYAIQAAIPLMKSQKYGRIVNISSGAGRTVSLTGIQAYASAKAGQLGLTRQLAHELGPWNITVNAIAPGFILSNPTTQRQWESYGPEGQRQLIERIPLRRLGTPEDIAWGVLYLVSPMGRWVTGQTLSIDGGHTLI